MNSRFDEPRKNVAQSVVGPQTLTYSASARRLGFGRTADSADWVFASTVGSRIICLVLNSF
jgi:hypothetical protein